MSLDNLSVVDAIGIERATGDAILTIADSWDWEDEHEHLIALQEKINTYMRFIEGGEIWEAYPNARDRKLIIDIVTRYVPTQRCREFLERAGETTSRIGVTLRYRHYPGS